MKRLVFLVLIMAIPMLLTAKDPMIDDWPSGDGDGGGCVDCVTTVYIMGDGRVVVSVSCGPPTVAGIYKSKCKIISNICELSGDSCTYNP